jgi:hypothetical protein
VTIPLGPRDIFSQEYLLFLFSSLGFGYSFKAVGNKVKIKVNKIF